MSPMLLAVLSIVVLLVLIFLRMPISFALFAVGLSGMVIFAGPGAALQLIASDIYRQASSYSMVVIPLFIFMGQVIFNSGMSTKLFNSAYKWLGHFPGGVAATTIAASAAFSAVSGSNAAATATMGAIAIPEMKKYGYDKKFAGGTVAIGGTLGILIPPSTALIIIAVQSEQSITTLFRAALFPGVLVGTLLVITALVVAWRKPALGPVGPKATWGERFRSLGGTVEIAVIFVFAVVGMFVGWFTPTEAAGVGAAGAVLIAVLTRSLTWAAFRRSVTETLRISAFVVLLVVGAVAFGRFLTLTRMPFELADSVQALPVAPVVVLLIVLLIYLLGGALMDGLGFLVISIPLFFPLLSALGYDLVWTTIIVALVTTLGAVTPPIGVNAFIVTGIDPDISIVDTFRGVAPYFVPYVLVIAAFIVWPGLILFAA
ncbi:tripartite ATP-independent transporter DctM subunit [Rhodoglobus vestalii]|uniref:Tripartite ATP-independent transporter DctM subunit n=1 Tax=Rhodoglobus vestalii TaxID=193384 RepID=A0A8H2K8K4_9MICO|nr:TRAP transporter large permease [Rhodoglobus vestalii]TQO20057.1 tripartite ATP-independent transporter DctM subunit [Rhodoglobus vestalii]